MWLNTAKFLAICTACAYAASEEPPEPLYPPTPYRFKQLVTSRALQWRIRTEPLLKHAQTLEKLAYNTTGRNRLMGTPGHEGTVQYLYSQLTHPSLGGYYNVTLQPWDGRIQEKASADFFANNVNTSTIVAQFSPSTPGTVARPIVLVNNLGCNATDYPSAVSGNIALISRGTCPFAQKSALAGRAGALGAVVYNNVPGPIPGMTLGAEDGPFGKAVPTVGISHEDGLALVNIVQTGKRLDGSLYVLTIIRNITTHNVLAQSKYGNPNSILMLGAHSDSVEAGPGINDNGSGLAGILEVAKQLANFRVRNTVRFGWWSGEEEGLLGSSYYVSKLSESEKKKIKLYLNFDMIASPNYQYGIFDGDGGDFNITGPPGSGSIEELFENYFESRDLNYTSIAFNGRSDYDPFTQAGIAAGGIETGAEGNKTAAGVEEFGGWVGTFDPNYHQAGDKVSNLNMTAFSVNAQAIAHGVATYARSFSSVDYSNGTEADDGEEELKKRRNRDVVRRKSGGVEKAYGKVKKQKEVWRSRRFRNEFWV